MAVYLATQDDWIAGVIWCNQWVGLLIHWNGNTYQEGGKISYLNNGDSYTGDKAS